jgi:hypothetical protein
VLRVHRHCGGRAAGEHTGRACLPRQLLLLLGHSRACRPARTVRHRFGSSTVDIVSGRGAVFAHHLRAANAGMLVSTDEHVTALSAMWRPFPTVVDEVDPVDFQHDVRRTRAACTEPSSGCPSTRTAAVVITWTGDSSWWGIEDCERNRSGWPTSAPSARLAIGSSARHCRPPGRSSQAGHHRRLPLSEGRDAPARSTVPLAKLRASARRRSGRPPRGGRPS